MSRISVVATVDFSGSRDVSHISDLEIYRIDGVERLFATTRYDGLISSWAIGQAEPRQVDLHGFDGGLAPGRDGALAVIQTPQGQAILTGGTASGGLQLIEIDASGLLTDAVALGGTTASLGALQDLVTVSLLDGRQAVYGALGGRDGIGQLTFSAGGALQGSRIYDDTFSTYAARVADLAHLNVGGQDYLYSLSGTEHGLTLWSVAPDGLLAAGPSLGAGEGLWISAPTALATARVEGANYLVLAAAGSSSLSVIEGRLDGSLKVVDHVIDNRDTRFGSVSAVETAVLDGQTYVVSGGGDGGLTIHQLLPGGRLAVLDTIDPVYNNQI